MRLDARDLVSLSRRRLIQRSNLGSFEIYRSNLSKGTSFMVQVLVFYLQLAFKNVENAHLYAILSSWRWRSQHVRINVRTLGYQLSNDISFGRWFGRLLTTKNGGSSSGGLDVWSLSILDFYFYRKMVYGLKACWTEFSCVPTRLEDGCSNSQV